MRSIAVGSCGMAFGQSAGPPASGRQLSELVELLEAAGHSDFRDARGPMGFNQRQAGGKFTQEEAEAFIEQLQSEVYGDGPPADYGSEKAEEVDSGHRSDRLAGRALGRRATTARLGRSRAVALILAQVVPLSRAFVLCAETTSPLQFGHDLVDELLDGTRAVNRRQHEAITADLVKER
jgi:hypothetical protein